MSNNTHKGGSWLWAASPSYARQFRDPAAVDWFLDGIPVIGDCVDIGCGYGEVVEGLFKRGAKRLVAVDISPDALATAKSQVPVLETVLGTLPDLPLPDASFDLVFCRNVLHLLGDIDRQLAELIRLIKPGGRLVIEVPTAHDGEEQRHLEELECRLPKRHFRLTGAYLEAASASGVTPEGEGRTRDVVRGFAPETRSVCYTRLIWRKL